MNRLAIAVFRRTGRTLMPFLRSVTPERRPRIGLATHPLRMNPGSPMPPVAAPGRRPAHLKWMKNPAAAAAKLRSRKTLGGLINDRQPRDDHAGCRNGRAGTGRVQRTERDAV